MMIDSHCHLDYLVKKGYAIPDIIKRAQDNNVTGMITISTTLNNIDQVMSIAHENENVWCSVGVHPDHVAEDGVPSLQDLLSYTSNPKVVAIGETGLDYYRTTEFKAQQKESFIHHIQASQESNLPVVVHTRDADEDTIDIIRAEYKNKPYKGLIHCFTASFDLAKAAMDIGFMISISGIVTFKSAKDLQESVKKIPLEHLIIETDSPFLAPVPYRGKVNEPAYVKETAQFLADLKGISLEKLMEHVNTNMKTVFPKIYT